MNKLEWFFDVAGGAGIKGTDDNVFESKQSHASELLAREIVQNVIDSKDKNSSQPTRLRITYISQPKRQAADLLRDIIGELYDKYLSNVPSIANNPRSSNVQDKDTKYLLIEDYGTTGLRGSYDHNDIKRYRFLSSIKTSKEDFNENEERELQEMNLLSWKLADGISNKTAKQMGSRGLGKKALHHASEYNTCLEISKRLGDEDRKILGGTCRLNDSLTKTNRQEGSSTVYSNLGFFGILDQGSFNWCKPANDSGEHKQRIDEFCKTLKIDRNDIGTSFVIPFLRYGDPKKIFTFMITNFYLSVDAGDIEIEYKVDDETLIRVNKDNLKSFLQEKDMKHQLNYLAFNEDCRKLDEDEATILKEDACEDRQFTKNDFKDGDFEKFRSHIRGGGTGYLRVPLILKSLNNETSKSQFHVYIRKHETGDPRSSTDFIQKNSNKKLFRDKYFIEEGISLDDIKSSRYQILVLVKEKDNVAFEFVRDSEDANHRKLQYDNSKLRSKWTRETRESAITTIIESARSLIETISVRDEGSDIDSADWYSMGGRDKKKPIKPTPPGPPIIRNKTISLLKITDDKKGKVDFSINDQIPVNDEQYFEKGVRFKIDISCKTREGQNVPFLINLENKEQYSIHTQDCDLISKDKHSFTIEAKDINFRFMLLYKAVDTLNLVANANSKRLS